MALTIGDLVGTPDQFGAVLSYLVATEPSFADQLGGAVVPVLEHELLADVADRVQRCGGEASVVVLTIDHDEDGVERARVVVGRMSSRAPRRADDCHVPFDRRCTVRDLLAVIGDGASITLRFSGQELEFQDFDLSPEVRLSDDRQLSFV
jgi:hypothetical protein